MIRKRAKVGDTIRLIVPGMDTRVCLPPGTVIQVVAHMADPAQACYILGRVVVTPGMPEEYIIVVPKGAKVNVVEE